MGGEDSLNLIPEEAMLPFPDAGLPSDVGAGPNSALLQRGSGIVAKMKELAKQVRPPSQLLLSEGLCVCVCVCGC